MYSIRPSSQFKRDLKLAIKRGCDMSVLDKVVTMLSKGDVLPEKYRDHALSGIYSGCRECHLSPDWLLVYEVWEQELLLYLVRTGSHSDLFR